MTEKEWSNIFALKLQKLMHERGMTEMSLSAASGLGQPAIWRYLHAQRVPLVTSALNIAKVLGVSLDELLDYGDMIGRYEMSGGDFYNEFKRSSMEGRDVDGGL